jgi:cellulose synthase/poly-beta-1,6-N-acetylglucosamine synthase-like glycosyltransferase
MNTWAIIFWVLIFIVFYSYLGYGLLLFILVKIKRLFKKHEMTETKSYEPEVTLFVAAYNEKNYVDMKVKNGYSMNYPQEKIKQVWVTDGSDDGTP